MTVVRGVITDEIDDRRPRPARVVEVRGAIAKAGAEVQQCDRWTSGHAAIAVGGARHDAFEEREDSSHLRDGVELSDEVHLGGSRVREARVDARSDKRADQRLRTVHPIPQLAGPLTGTPSRSSSRLTIVTSVTDVNSVSDRLQAETSPSLLG